MLLLAGLSTGHKVGLAVMAAIFIGFALVSSFVLPKRNPDFPGRGRKIYYGISFLLLVCMLAAVVVFGRESETSSAAAVSKSGPPKGTIQVVEAEWRVTLPPTAHTLAQGVYVFHVVNKGKLPHNLTIDGPRVAGVHTPNVPPGGSAELKVTLATGQYDLFCSIPGHKQQGMDAKLSVG